MNEDKLEEARRHLYKQMAYEEGYDHHQVLGHALIAIADELIHLNRLLVDISKLMTVRLEIECGVHVVENEVEDSDGYRREI